MKKLFSILIALALLAGVSTMAFAAEAGLIGYSGGIGLGTLRSVTCTNNSSSTTQTMLPVANKEISNVYTEPGIIPGKVKILGYDISALGPNGVLVNIVDAASYSIASGDIIAETEATLSVPVAKIFPVGLILKFGLFIEQAPYSTVTVYYVQDQG
jgi:hypothetical protein